MAIPILYQRLALSTLLGAVSLTAAAVAPDQLTVDARTLNWRHTATSIWQSEIELHAGSHHLQLNAGQPSAVPLAFYRQTTLPEGSAASWQFEFPHSGKLRLVLHATESKSTLRLVPLKAASTAAQAAPSPAACPRWDGEAVTVATGGVFSEGQWLRDYYSGQRARVNNASVTLQPAPNSGGLLLLEAETSRPADVDWRNATIYFITTDRFYNGNPQNDNSYGRLPDDKDEIGTFHGGDLAGIRRQLDYLEQLGVNALWLSAPYEQIHGWVGGGTKGDFKHYAYHGYYALDFTRLDANMGTEDELRALIDDAHRRGMRIIFDVVMNHPGYATLQDMQQLGFGKIRDGLTQHLPANWNDWQPESWESYHDYHNLIDYDHPDWLNWWGPDWVRAGIGGYDAGPSVIADPQRGSLAFLPDFRTESNHDVQLPVFLQHKADTRAVNRSHATPRDYLIEWLTGWVAEYGIDGFRIDTAKHVELTAWKALKHAASKAQADWQASHPGSDRRSPFWMVGEVWGQGPERNRYHDNGFDALINFDFQHKALAASDCLARLEPVYKDYARRLQQADFNLLSYISSHDTQLFSTLSGGSLTRQRQAGSALMLLPGAIQLYYGDESARPFGPTGSDPTQGTRSAMNWGDLQQPPYQALLKHWQTLGRFRQRHPAIGSGTHQQRSAAPYSFSRTLGEDRVIIVYAGKSAD